MFPATLAELLVGAARRFPDLPALRWKCGELWRDCSFDEFEQQVARAAAGLAALGVGPGERVALLSPNRPEWLVADFAIMSLGAITVTIHATLPADQVMPILQDARPRVLIAADAQQAAKVNGMRAAAAPSGREGRAWRLEAVVCFDEEDAPSGTLGWDALLELGAPGGAISAADAVTRVRERARMVAGGDVASIIYTSGATGEPKGVMLTHANLCYMIAATYQHGSLPLAAGDVALSLLPLSHVLERAIELCYVNAGVCIAFAESFERAPANIRQIRPHFMAAVPRLFEKAYARAKGGTGLLAMIVNWAERVGGRVVDERLAGRTPARLLRLQHAIADRLVFTKLRRAMGGRIKAFIAGGAPLAEDVARFFLAAGITVYEGYGLTETAPVLAANGPGRTRLGSVGTAYPAVQLRVGEQGEILARTPGLMKGYWNRPELQVVDADGWFHTGDIGHIDDDGFLWITDRLKDLVVTAGGKNVAPAPIESHAATSPYISQAVLIGDRRPYTVLLVTLDWPVVRAWAAGEGLELEGPEQAAAAPRVRQLVEAETLHRLHGLAPYEQPKKIAIIPEEFTIEQGLLTPTLKVRRRAVEARYAAVIEQLYQGGGTPAAMV